MNLTIQTFLDGHWMDAAVLKLLDEHSGRTGLSVFNYEMNYALENLYADALPAVSVTVPVTFETYRSKNWFSFLDDVMPAGASRRWWIKKLNLGDLSPSQQDLQLLSRGTIAPIGNLRIKESIEGIKRADIDFRPNDIRFRMSEVVERTSGFLEYAQAMGAASGGATGAGGEAPKLVVRKSPDDQVWIDTYQDDPANMDDHYLVKFPRGASTELDCNILRAEYHYYSLLAEMGLSTIDTAGLKLFEGNRYPSLWLPRFDVTVENGRLLKHGLESVYSILGKHPGDHLNHMDCIQTLSTILSNQHSVKAEKTSFDNEQFVIDWVRRDFLNVCFGNSDNHGRNTAFLKNKEEIKLSPIYDFAPMRADPEGITRTTTWGRNLELAGQYKWFAIADSVSTFVAPEKLIAELRTLAKKILGLGEQLEARGVHPSLIAMPTMGLIFLDANLKKWDLI